MPAELTVALAAGGADGVDDGCGGQVLAPLLMLQVVPARGLTIRAVGAPEQR
jgi:hypothetical protein